MMMSPLLGRVDLPLDQYRNLAPAQIEWSDDLTDSSFITRCELKS